MPLKLRKQDNWHECVRSVRLKKLSSAILSAEWLEDKPNNVCIADVTYILECKVSVIQKYSVNGYFLIDIFKIK